ncbi:MAG: 23S rRNA (guanosine(2251)-2'-O)-methyltransferase RlmB, partial [Clostridia bacterium]
MKNENIESPITARTEHIDNENIIYGRNSVLELIKSGKPVDKIFVSRGEREGSITLIVAEALKRQIPVIEVDKRKIYEYGDNCQGVAAMIPEMEYASLEDIIKLAAESKQPLFVVILDHVNDPHNLGAIIRSAECAGAHGVIIPKRNAATLNAAAVKASAGAAMHIPVCKVANITATIELLKKNNVWIYAAESGGESLYDAKFEGATALVFGSEDNGISRLVKEKSD